MKKIVITAIIFYFSSSALFSQNFDEQIKQMSDSFDAFVAEKESEFKAFSEKQNEEFSAFVERQWQLFDEFRLQNLAIRTKWYAAKML